MNKQLEIDQKMKCEAKIRDKEALIAKEKEDLERSKAF